MLIINNTYSFVGCYFNEDVTDIFSSLSLMTSHYHITCVCHNLLNLDFIFGYRLLPISCCLNSSIMNKFTAVFPVISRLITL